MQLTAINISNLTQSSITIIERDQPFFSSEYHFHPEFEMVYIKEGYGKKIIGSSVYEFNKDELVLLGANLPHVWISDKSELRGKTSKATVVYFDAGIFSDLFFKMDETKQLNKLFINAKQGILITGDTKRKALLKLKKLRAAKGFNKIICLLDMLNVIAGRDEIVCFSHKPVIRQSQASERLTQVFDYINSNLKKTIALKDVAKIVNLTPESFCRYFKQKTGKRFIDYLHETRIFNAKQLLLNSDFTVAEIAYKSGFKTASNFNKLFKKNTGFCPTEFRKVSD